MNPILHIILEEQGKRFLLQSLLCANVKCFPMLFPEMYKIKQLIKQLHFRRFNSPEKESVKIHAPTFVPLYPFKSLSKAFILQGISQETGRNTAMSSTANKA